MIGAMPSGNWSSPFAYVCEPPGTSSLRRARSATGRAGVPPPSRPRPRRSRPRAPCAPSPPPSHCSAETALRPTRARGCTRGGSAGARRDHADRLDHRPEADAVGREIHGLMEELFPVPRSLTGDGVRATLARIGEDVPSGRVEPPTGTGLRLDAAAGVERPGGMGRRARRRARRRRVRLLASPAGLQRSGRHHRRPRDAGRAPLHDPRDPDVVPYRTSYWAERWGFCTSRRSPRRCRKASTASGSTRRLATAM